MTKSILRIGKMNKKTLQRVSVLSVFLVAGCSGLDYFGAGNTYTEDGTTTVTETQMVPVATVEQAPAAPVPCAEPAPVKPVIVPPTEPADNDFVNYRETAADYREFGERNPRDQRIVTAGAGSNMAASIPPTIEEEVMDYEEEINAAMSDAEDGSDSQSSTTGDDPVEDWLAEEGSTLKGLLSDWSERSGWRLIWNTNRNYTLAAGAMFRGRFADVSSALIRTFARARPAPVATFYKGNRVLVVETMEDENAFN